ncbi:MAG: TIGR03987 family protein [Candidatus Yanofskybacteria bacterium]|nr:TIGR03987 family protein [Candidatus Yanofskybacteria bacterium]
MRPFETFFVVALLLYSFVIWSHRIKKRFSPWMVWLFGAGLAADVSGTVFLCVATASGWTFSVHAISGLISLLIMALHFIWALLSITLGGKFEDYFKRFSVLAWFLWLIAFVSGIPR